MNMIITGASGFIGSRLLRVAREKYGSTVTSFSSRESESSHITYSDLPGFGLSSTDLAIVSDAEVLIHAGAFIPKRGSEANNILACNGNISFTEKLLNLPWHSLKVIVFLSTIDVYADIDEIISEITPTDPETLYGLSKLYCERMISQYAAERGIAYNVLRIGHVYGPGEENYAKVMPKAIQNIVNGKDIELWGEGKERRSFIYIDDVVTAILNSVEKNGLGVINVVGGKAISIIDLLNKLISISGRSVNIMHQEFSGMARDFVFDNAKLKQDLLPNEKGFTEGLLEEFRYIEKLNLIRE